MKKVKREKEPSDPPLILSVFRSRNMLKWIILFLVVVSTAAALSPVLKSRYTNWDDEDLFVSNPVVRSLNQAHIRKFFDSAFLNTYIPLTMLSFSIEYHFWKYNPFVSHLINLLLHLGIVMLLFGLALRLGLNPLGAGIAALLFGIHPMHVESIAWVVERKDLLYSIFYVLALYHYEIYATTNKKIFYGMSLLWGVLSILSKPMALSLPLVLFILDYLRRRRIDRWMILEKILFFFYIVPIAWVTYRLHARIPLDDMREGFLTWIWSYTFYFKKFFWPQELVPLYQIPKPVSFVHGDFILALLIFLLIGLMIWRFRKNRWIIFALAFHFFSVFFLIPLDLKVSQLVADRFMYLPSLGICLWLGRSWGDYIHNPKTPTKVVFIVFSFGLMALLGVRSFDQCKVWKDSLSLWSFVLHQNTAGAIVYNNLGLVESQRGRFEESLRYFELAVQQDPLNADAYNNMGVLTMRQGDYDKALDFFNKVLAISPRNSKAWANRGTCYIQKGRYQEANRDYTKALEMDPLNVKALVGRGFLYSQWEEWGFAMRNLDLALRIDPDNSAAHYGKGRIYYHFGMLEDAIKQYTLSLTIDPDYREAYHYRSLAYFNQGKYQEALADALKAKSLGYKEEGDIEELQNKAMK